MAKKSMIIKLVVNQNSKYVNILVVKDAVDLMLYLENMEFAVFVLEN